MMTTISRVDYADAEARGRIRQWKKRLERNYLAFDRGYRRLQGGDLRDLSIDMVRRGRIGRLRALEKIHAALGPGAKLETSTLDDGDARAIWSIFKPRDSVVYDASPEEQSLLQDCVTVNYFAAGAMPGMIGVAEGLWTLEVPDHALGRAVERSRLLHPGALIREAHLNLLDLPVEVVSRSNFTDHDSPGVYIKAGSGCFAAHINVSPDRSLNGDYTVYVRVETWLSDDQLHEDQIPLLEKGAPGNCLGDSWLIPRPYCSIKRCGENELRVQVWRPAQRDLND
jgi:hypothetical protein